MELWIRSQDRETMVSNPMLIVDNSRILVPKNDYRDTHLILGHYKTKQRALEVLDEIQNLINPKIVIKQGKPLVKTVDGTVYREPDEVEIKELNVVFYKMPEE